MQIPFYQCIAWKVRTDDTIETRLFMRRVSPDSFRKYTIFAENPIDTGQQEVELLESK